MKKVLLVYDNHIMPDVFIRNVIGEKQFGDVILKRKSIRNQFFDELSAIEFVNEVMEIDHAYELDKCVQRLERIRKDSSVFHIFSYATVRKSKEMLMALEKMQYIQSNVVLTKNGHPMVLMVKDIATYQKLLKKDFSELNQREFYTDQPDAWELLESEAFFDVSEYSAFLQYISGGFDARFFNSVRGDEHTVVKTSTDKRKICAEYNYYRLLPEQMKPWFVMPYSLRETDKTACYTMERYRVADLAIRWVHGAISLEECEQILHKIFRFIDTREQRQVEPAIGRQTVATLYVKKVEERIKQLKNLALYPQLHALIQSGTAYQDIDEIFARYVGIYEEKAPQRTTDYQVIGHGDLCFSNMLFHKDASLLKLIDPKGANEERELWTDTYYDVCKLSHSICGLYDFFNNALYEIILDNDLKLHLTIELDNQKYKRLFSKICVAHGFNYELVRVYEVSLFLSMLPLHMDNPHKVFGFILNAIKIMDEVETCLKN